MFFRVLISVLFISYAQHVQAQLSYVKDSLEQKIDLIKQNLNIDISYDSGVIDTWQSVNYDVCDPASLPIYLDILLKEYLKYPAGYFSKVGIHTIVLTNNLKFEGQARAAVPDPYKSQLYLSVNGAYGTSSDSYLIHVMHHELQHCTEHAIWKDMMYDWQDWMLLNTTGFKYGNGGASVYKDATENNVDVYSAVNPQKGFINLYSLTGDEEDRAEMMAYIFTDTERPMLQEILKKDAVLRRKIDVLKKLINSFTGKPFLVFPIL
jgi:hypothetical protein